MHPPANRKRGLRYPIMRATLCRVHPDECADWPGPFRCVIAQLSAFEVHFKPAVCSSIKTPASQPFPHQNMQNADGQRHVGTAAPPGALSADIAGIGARRGSTTMIAHTGLSRLGLAQAAGQHPDARKPYCFRRISRQSLLFQCLSYEQGGARHPTALVSRPTRWTCTAAKLLFDIVGGH